MGHGSSVTQKPLQWTMVNAETQEGSKRLSRDSNFRCTFVHYIKSSEWLDHVSVNLPSTKVFNTNCVPADFCGYTGGSKGALLSYQMTVGKLIEVEGIIFSASLNPFARSITNPVTPRSVKVEVESYFNIEDCPCFDKDQYLALLFHTLYPAFLRSRHYQRYLKYGIEHGRAVREDADSISSSEVHAFTTSQAIRLQDMLLGCAAYFDESILMKGLKRLEWVSELTSALDGHSHAISMVDDGDKILYTNKAFKDMTELSSEDLRGENLDILNGPNTEVSQLLLLQKAMLPMHSAKFAITYYTKSKRAFTDLVAVKTTAHYSVAVHFPAVKGANMENLQVFNCKIFVFWNFCF